MAFAALPSDGHVMDLVEGVFAGAPSSEETREASVSLVELREANLARAKMDAFVQAAHLAPAPEPPPAKPPPKRRILIDRSTALVQEELERQALEEQRLVEKKRISEEFRRAWLREAGGCVEPSERDSFYSAVSARTAGDSVSGFSLRGDSMSGMSLRSEVGAKVSPCAPSLAAAASAGAVHLPCAAISHAAGLRARRAALDAAAETASACVSAAVAGGLDPVECCVTAWCKNLALDGALCAALCVAGEEAVLAEQTAKRVVSAAVKARLDPVAAASAWRDKLALDPLTSAALSKAAREEGRAITARSVIAAAAKAGLDPTLAISAWTKTLAMDDALAEALTRQNADVQHAARQTMAAAREAKLEASAVVPSWRAKIELDEAVAASLEAAAAAVEAAVEIDDDATAGEAALPVADGDAMSEALEALRVQFPQASESELRRKLRAQGKGKQTGCVLQ